MTPGQAERAEGELRAAREALEVGRIALERNLLRDATSRLYYAAFHAARAALVVRGLHVKTHSGLTSLFAETYGSAAILSTLLQRRGEADYSFEEFAWPREAVGRAADDAEGFVERCERIVREALEEGPDEPDPPPDL